MNGDVLGSSVPDEEQDHGHWSCHWSLREGGGGGTSPEPNSWAHLATFWEHVKGHEINNRSGSQRERDQGGREPVHQATMGTGEWDAFICFFIFYLYFLTCLWCTS